MNITKDKTSSHYIEVLLAQARKLGLDVDEISASINLPENLTYQENEWLDNKYLTRLVKAIWSLSKDEGMGYFEEKVRPGTSSLTFDYMMTAKNLDGFYRRGERILSYLSADEYGFKFYVENDTAYLTINEITQTQDVDQFITEFLLLIWHRFACWAIDEHIPLLQASFTYSKPKHSWFYTELFHCDLKFGHAFTGFSFSKRYLRKIISRSQRELELWLRDSPADLMYLSPTDPSMTASVKSALRTYLETQKRILDFETICEGFNMTPQVVRRRLVSEGSSYQKIKDAVRRHLAFELLKNKQIPISDIAVNTGFSEAAAFSRAFKKWTGKSPAAYRKSVGSKIGK